MSERTDMSGSPQVDHTVTPELEAFIRELEAFIRERVASDRFDSGRDVVHQWLRLLEEREHAELSLLGFRGRALVAATRVPLR